MSKGLTFNTNAIKSAISQLKNTRNELSVLDGKQLEKIALEARDYCRSITPELFGELIDSTVAIQVSENHWVVTQLAPHAQFVEFGTGYVGNDNPHEALATYAPQWDYVSGEQILANMEKGIDGWWYMDERTGDVGFTRGQEANMQMYRTFAFLKQKHNDVDIELSVRGDYFG